MYAVTIGALMCASVYAGSPLRLGSLFTDHMVVQSGARIAVWGWAEPGGKVTVSLGESRGRAKVSDDGSWSVELKPVPAGGPYIMTVIAGDTVKVNDVLCGEVWVCSGQSNMQWPVLEADNPTEEIASARWPHIRMFSVERRTADTPQDTCVGTWEPATPDHVAHFSAVGYFFGRGLHQALQVPIGLIHASWSGTPAEAWTTEETLRDNPELAPILAAAQETGKQASELLATLDARRAEWEERVKVLRDQNGALPKRHVDTGNRGFESGWAAPDANVSEWQEMVLPGLWDKDYGFDIDGALWFRRTVDIPESWAGKPLQLSLGAVDDFDVTYWNGEQIGSTGSETPSYWIAPRHYTVPGAKVSPGTATIAVRVFDNFGGGGFAGEPSQMRLAAAGDTVTANPIRLDGAWRYRIERELPPLLPPSVPRDLEPQYGPTVLFNAMIHPLLPYTVKGVVWYQGEANAGRAHQYRTLLPALIGDWRKGWRQDDLPFGVVQLANFMERATVPSSSEWAELREAQLLTARNDENIGLAVAIDIGEADNIHPKNKQEVGRRLCLWALGTVYGRDTVYSGPLYESASVADGKVEVTFSQVGSGLIVKGDTLTGFAIAGPDSQFVWADAVISGKNTVTVCSGKVTMPLSVRYGWANNPACNLYNKEGLPASPFRTDGWPGVTVGRK